MTNFLKRLLVTVLWKGIGRRNLVRLGRFLSMEGRLDLNGDVHSHGEPLLRRTVLQHGARPLRVVDAGAHTGEWSAALLDECGREGREDVYIHLFEPASATYARLEERLAGHPAAERLSFEQKALSRKAGEAFLHIVHDLAGTNSLHVQSDLSPAVQEQVVLATLDGYARERGFDRVDLLKIDVEGHDFEVLAGARTLLEARQVEVIQFEYNFRWVYARHFLRDVFEMLAPLGYRIGKLTGRGVEFYDDWHPELETFREANFVACLEPWRERFPTLPWWNA